MGKNNGFLGYISRSAARRARRATSKALRAFTTPLLPDDYVGLLNPLRGRELRGRIESVEHHSNFTTINIMSGPGLKPDFRPGQFIGVGLRLDGVWRWRCYSLTNPPATEAGASIAASSSDANHLRRFTISIKPVPGGLFSGHLADNAEPGQLIRLSAPGGDFYLPGAVTSADCVRHCWCWDHSGHVYAAVVASDSAGGAVATGHSHPFGTRA